MDTITLSSETYLLESVILTRKGRKTFFSSGISWECGPKKNKTASTNRNSSREIRCLTEKIREKNQKSDSARRISRIFRQLNGRISSWPDCTSEKNVDRRKERRKVGEKGALLSSDTAEKEKETRETLSPAGMNNSVRARIVGRAHVQSRIYIKQKVCQE